MARHAFDMRTVFQGAIAVGLFFLSWIYLLLVPVMGGISILLSPAQMGFGVALFAWLFLVLMSVLLAFFMRWIARGILREKKGRIAFTAFVAVALGAASMIHPTITGVFSGTLSLLAAICLFWLLFTRPAISLSTDLRK